MTGFTQPTYSDDRETDDTGARSEDATGSHSEDATGAHSDGVSSSDSDVAAHPAESTAADRLGGPSEAEQESAHSAPESAGAADQGSTGQGSTGQGSTGQGSDKQGNATLIPQDKAEGFRGRWKELKGDFVDEPRTAVRGANELVGEVLDELEQLFRRQRDELERGLDSDDTSTEDLRQALGKYRSFFDRLLSV